MRFLTGGYTADMDGAATGIGLLTAGAADEPFAWGQLAFAPDAAATGGSPSWVSPHPGLDVVYAALEADGAVQAFARTGEASFTRLGDPVPAGDLVCHVAVAPGGEYLVASCWGDGRVVRMAVDATGRPSAPVIAPAAADPYAEPDLAAVPAPNLAAFPAPREQRTAEDAGNTRSLGEQLFSRREGEGVVGLDLGSRGDRDTRHALGSRGDRDEGTPAGEDARVSRAHQACFLPGGLIATTDMGLDLVRFWRDAHGTLRSVGQVVLPRSTGPRHMRRHPSGHLYVVTELSCEVFVLAPDASGAWRLVGGVPLGPGLLDGDAAAELVASGDGEYLYAGVRGSNTIAVLRVRGDGSQLQPVALVEAGVDWPRHHAVIRDTLLVAGQRSNEVASLTLDLRTGVPGRVRRRVAAPSPTCLMPLR
ncbi:lactonase family protein [Microbacterium luticocti]|uniref:lactonase family protein n=1 Tax=Microbacterium luticocti TaxID=451764 RepID=UPI0003FD1392|nr:beta-propeller fold lactonase family protein [Microbacterium luticocti]